ncbi:MAG: signal peptidase I [Erysipelotrichaceae bacterium]|nr:signal peptidase I [Erysipelotrichaceae bacterium]
MKLKQVLFSIVEFVIVVAITICVFRFVAIPIRIDGSSMENTLHDSDIALINAIGVNEDHIDRFDVVVAYSDQLDEKIIKRVIGLPGETIAFVNDVLYVDGEIVVQDFLDEDFVEASKATYNVDNFTEDFEVTLGEDEYFLMGDNRLRSTDSRVLGAFSIDDIIGFKGLVIYPFDSIQWLD